MATYPALSSRHPYQDFPGPADAYYPAQRFSARHIWQVIRRHELLLGAIVFFTVLVVLITQLTATPIYEATSGVQVELNDDKGLPDAAAKNQERAANEAGLYRSRSLAERVVQDMRLLSDPRFTPNPLPRGQEPEPGMVSRAAGKLMSMTNVYGGRDGDFITISIRSPDPELAADIANQYPVSLAGMRQTAGDKRREQVASDLEKEQQRLGSEAEAAELAVANFRRQNEMLTGAGGSEDYAQINRIAVEAASAAAMRAASGARAAGVSQAVSNSTTAGASSALLDQQQRRLDELMRERSDLTVMYGVNHPKVKSVDAMLAETRANLAREESTVAANASRRAAVDAAKESGLARSEAAAASARAGTLEAQLREMIGKAYLNTSNSVELNALERRAEAARLSYLATAQRAQEVRASLDAAGIHSHLVSPAAVPGDPISPRPKSTTMAAFVGSLIIGLMIIFGIEMTDNRLWNGEQMFRLFGLRTMAMIPELSGEGFVSAENNPILQNPHSLLAEVARGLGAEVTDLAHHGASQTVLITSPVMGDGKSTAAMILAAAAASAGRRAVVVDLDLRRPGTSGLHPSGQAENVDLVDYLTGSVEIGGLLPAPQAIEASRESASYRPVVLSAREPVRDSVALMRSGRIRQLLADLRQRYDLVVINAPAALATLDARVLIDAADSTLLVVRWGKTTVDQVRATMHVLRDQVDGVIFNRVDYDEHARRGYGDSVQFYMESAAYYSGPIPKRRKLSDRFVEGWRKFAPNFA